MEITRRFARFICGLTFEDIPSDVVQAARERLLDNLGAAVAGCKSWIYRKEFLEACAVLGIGEQPVIGGAATRFPTAGAAMINATFAQANELDDGHIYAGVHAGSVVVATALSVGAEARSSGKDILTAIVIGYEIAYRLGVAMSPHLVLRGFHPPSVLDACAAAAVTAKLRHFSEEQTANALGLAGLYNNGLMEATLSGQQMKCVMVGRAASSGIMAAEFAARGMEGTLTVFEGKTGMFFAMSRDVDPDAVCQGLGETYTIGDTYVKLYPTSRHAQAGIEAVLDLQQEHGFSADDVEEILVGTYQISCRLAGNNHHPQTPGEAKFSIPFGLAVGLTTGGISPGFLTGEHLMDEKLLGIADRVLVFVEDEIEEQYPKLRGAHVRVLLKDGRVFENTLFALKGSPEKPIGWTGLEQKFVANCSEFLGKDSARRMADKIRRTETIEDIGELYTVFCNNS